MLAALVIVVFGVAGGLYLAAYAREAAYTVGAVLGLGMLAYGLYNAPVGTVLALIGFAAFIGLCIYAGLRPSRDPAAAAPRPRIARDPRTGRFTRAP